MYKTFGWINVVLLLVVLVPYILRLIGKVFVKSESKGYLSALKFFKVLHKPFAGLLVLSVVVHGSLAPGYFTLRTGLALMALVIITAILGIAFSVTSKKSLFKDHKLFAGLTLLMALVHLVFPYAFN